MSMGIDIVKIILGVKNAKGDRHYKNYFEVPQNSKTKFTIWSSYTTYGYIAKEEHILVSRYLLIHVYCCYSHKIQVIEASNMPINWLIDDKNVLYLHNEISFSY